MKNKYLKRVTKCHKVLSVTILLALSLAGFSQNISGYWGGEISIMGSKLGLFFNITYNDDGSLAATLDVPMQGAKCLPVSSITFENQELNIDIKSINATYKGEYTDDTFVGKFHQNGLSLPLTLQRSQEENTVERSQEPKEPFPYKSEDVTFTNSREGNKLAGTLTIPEGKGKFPAVVLVSGSGPQNRNEELMGHKPFLIISDYLTRNGIAVLRYDDRGVEKSEECNPNATTFDLSYDAEAAVDYLLTRPEIDKKHISVLGHSEGGAIAYMLAARNKKIHSIIPLAGPVVKGGEVLLQQQRDIYATAGFPTQTIEQIVQTNSKIFDIIYKSDSLNNELVNNITEYIKTNAGITDSAQLNVTVKEVTSPWMYYFIKLEMKAYIEKIKCPIYAFFGAKDLQVSAKQNIPALEEYTDSKAEIFLFENHNHLFQNCETGDPSEYPNISETIDYDVLKKITEVLKR